MSTVAPDVGTRVPVAARVALAVAAVTYSSWTLAGFTGSRLDPRTSYVSEVYALGEPWAVAFRAADAVAGLAALAAAWWLRPTVPRGRRDSARPAGLARLMRLTRPTLLTLVAVLGLAVFGAATLGDAAAPLSCTPTHDPVCSAAETQGAVPLHHTLHAVTSSIASTGALASTVAAAALTLTRRPRRGVAWAYVALAAASLAATAWVLVEVAAITPGPSGTPLLGRVGLDALGWAQRLQTLLVAATLLLAAARPPCAAAPDRAGPATTATTTDAAGGTS